MKLTVKEKQETVAKMLEVDPIGDFMQWLFKKGYFEAPAAKGHHGACEGGLFVHSLEMAHQLIWLTDKLGLEWDRKESPAIVGLLHDVCKLDDYTWDFYSTPEPGETNIWYNKNQIIKGHGDKSLLMLNGHFDLTEEEAMCIRFHMGAFVDREEWGYYSKAVHDYPNVLYTHTADMIASQILEK